MQNGLTKSKLRLRLEQFLGFELKDWFGALFQVRGASNTVVYKAGMGVFYLFACPVWITASTIQATHKFGAVGIVIGLIIGVTLGSVIGLLLATSTRYVNLRYGLEGDHHYVKSWRQSICFILWTCFVFLIVGVSIYAACVSSGKLTHLFLHVTTNH